MNIDAAHRVILNPRWRWMGGMQPLVQDEDGEWSAAPRIDTAHEETATPPPGAIPDLDDPATAQGCLLALVREAWDDPCAYATDLRGYDSRRWVCFVDDGSAHGMEFDGATEAEALVAALEAAR